MMSATIRAAGGALEFHSPYDAGMLADFKTRIPAADRRWDAGRKCWLVAAPHLATLENLCNRHGLAVVSHLAALYDAPAVVQRILEVRYIGAPKERGDGTMTAFGNVKGDWSAVFPQDVLRGWFEIGGIGTAPQPTAAATCYGILGVKRDADAAALKTAYRSMAKRWHPDVNRDPDATEMFKRIGHAWEILGDPLKRRRYDAGLALEASLGREDVLPSASIFADYWRPPLRCGLILVEGTERLGRVIVSKIHQWEPITDARGRELVTSWPAGSDTWLEAWI